MTGSMCREAEPVLEMLNNVYWDLRGVPTGLVHLV